eukprot:m.90959 g.90959  ORF g.90959 m.90959 type:complete len:170 (+) comp8482_c0_seq2:442-951(+)
MPGLFLNTDAMSVYLGDKDDPVLVTKACLAELKKERRGVCRMREEDQRRSIHLLATISAAGRHICSVAIIKDTTFTQLVSQKLMLQLNDSPTLYICRVPGEKVKPVDYMPIVLRQAIVPCVLAERSSSGLRSRRRCAGRRAATASDHPLLRWREAASRRHPGDVHQGRA